MLVNLVPEFLAVLAAPDPVAAYHEHFERHRPVLTSYWHNYVLDPASPQAEQVIAAALRADRADVVGGRGIAFVCLEHFTGRANPHTYGLGLAPHLLSLWIAHEAAHAIRYTSPTSRADLRRLVAELRGSYDYWDTGSRATLRELLVNEGAAVAAAQAAAPGFEPWEYFGYARRQFRRCRELDAFLRRVVAPELDQRGLGLRLRYLSGGTRATARLAGGKVLPERSGYYLGLRLVEPYLAEAGIASAVRAAAPDFQKADERALGMQTA